VSAMLSLRPRGTRPFAPLSRPASPVRARMTETPAPDPKSIDRWHAGETVGFAWHDVDPRDPALESTAEARAMADRDSVRSRLTVPCTTLTVSPVRSTTVAIALPVLFLS
jgi:hypothetical protein